jgi:Fanconi anemia group M protein
MAGVRAKRFVGQATKQQDRGLTQDEQSRVLEDLRRGTFNVLCATSIGEEGLDIPEVDLVVFYEPVPSEIRYIQRRGRTGRRAPGEVVILVTEGTSDEVYARISSERAERMKSIASTLNEQLASLLREREPPLDRMTEGEVERLTRGLEIGPTQRMVDDSLRVEEFNSSLRRAMQALYFRVLETDMEGLREDQLRSELEQEGFSRTVVELALKRMAKSKRVELGLGRVGIPVEEIPGSGLMVVKVERVSQGMAIVVLDGNWEARLEPSNYDGPRELIKKGSSFRAVCELYKSEGVLHVNIRQVVGLA